MSWRIVNPGALPTPRGWNHGLLWDGRGKMLFVAGQTASDASGRTDLDFVGQFRLALERVVAVVREAGGEPGHVGRLVIYVTNMDRYVESRKALGEVWRAVMGRHYPAMALVEVVRLVDSDTMVEIEAIAMLPDA
ncbi:MAG TPA: RidA family protein [Gemmatimonadota bacterium]|nr:RidA family protein [Gemmatimonadota bacterium]